MRRSILAAMATSALWLTLGSPVKATPYNITKAPYEIGTVPAIIDTFLTGGATTTDTLDFGKAMDWAVVWTDPSETVSRTWVFVSGSKLIQTNAAVPPNNSGSRRKSRYGSPRYSSAPDTLAASESSPLYLPGALKGVILHWLGTACTINVQAGTGRPW